MIKEDNKNFYSWEILNDSTLLKHCDKTVFAYSQTGIPKELKDFFGSFDETGTDIFLIYNNKKFLVNLRMFNGRARLSWRNDLKEEFTLFNNDIENVSLKFTKKEDNIFLNVLAKTYIDTDTDFDIEQVISTSKEGCPKEIVTKIYERSKILRTKAIQIHGTVCSICGFDFEKTYGPIGKDYIEIHHVQPLFLTKEEKEIDPEKDLIPVCSNCHRMLHRQKNKQLLPSDLKAIINNEGKNEF